MKLARNERGFTLIELMVVLIIIGILAAIAIPVMSKQTDKAKVKRAVSEVKSMKTTVDLWNNDPAQNTGALKEPKAVVGVAASDVISKVLQDGGMDITIKDPWNNSYHYIGAILGNTPVIAAVAADPSATPPVAAAPATYYKILSYGPNGTLGGGDDITVTDISNPQENQNPGTPAALAATLADVVIAP